MTEFKLPELGENIHQGDLVRLMVAPGATVSEGEPVMELETDKAVVEVPSSVSGTVKEVLVKQGEKIKVGQVIFTVDNGARPKKAANASESAMPTTRTASAPSAAAPQQTEARSPGAASSRASAAAIDSAVAEFKLPELGKNISQGELVRLMISPGA